MDTEYKVNKRSATLSTKTVDAGVRLWRREGNLFAPVLQWIWKAHCGGEVLRNEPFYTIVSHYASMNIHSPTPNLSHIHTHTTHTRERAREETPMDRNWEKYAWHFIFFIGCYPPVENLLDKLTG